MLIRFGVANYRSIRDYQELLLSATGLRDIDVNIIKNPGLREGLLPCVGMYGANASGKSNLFRAFDFFRDGILHSHTNKPGNGTPGTPFRLNKSFADEPIRFDCDFLFENTRYHYGYEMDRKHITQEWLYSYPTRQRKVLFHRNHNETKEFYFGKSLKGRNRVIEDLTKDNTLFLSVAAQYNHEILTPLYEYFKNYYKLIIDSEKISEEKVADYMNDEGVKAFMIEFLQLADVGITEVEINREKMSDEQKSLADDIASVVRKYVSGDAVTLDLPQEQVSLRLRHIGEDSETLFKISDESRGTIALLNLLGPLITILIKGGVLFVDELDASMHPLLSRKIISLVNSAKINIGNGQLIFNTHDTNLLRGNILRRDQIWIAEKDKSGATNIYPLSDINIRASDNLEKGYLQGRFGGIPFITGFSELLEGDCFTNSQLELRLNNK